MVFFWIVILIQIKLSPYARKMIFKALYAICGTVSVIGALSTSVFLLYKYKQDIKSSKKLHYTEKTIKRTKIWCLLLCLISLSKFIFFIYWIRTIKIKEVMLHASTILKCSNRPKLKGIGYPRFSYDTH